MLDAIVERSNLRRAFERVRENQGCRGADGMTVGQVAADLERELDRLQDRLLRRCYHPFPLLRIGVPKRSGGLRHLAVPTVRDRIVQTAVDQVVRPVFEAEFEDCSYAFRQGRSVRDAVRKVCELRERGYRWLVDADVDDCFGSIPHDRLLDRLARLPLDPYVLELFERWIRAEVYDGRRLFLAARGIPQGSVVSPLLANLFLDELDESLALFEQAVVRYADDFLVLCRDRERAEGALEVTDALLDSLGLALNRRKTEITSFAHGFKFLGALFVDDDVYLPFRQTREEPDPPGLPPPLDLWTYLELKHGEGDGLPLRH
jgi:group II intron reverse transcriptase/maturase